MRKKQKTIHLYIFEKDRLCIIRTIRLRYNVIIVVSYLKEMENRKMVMVLTNTLIEYVIDINL